MPLAPRFVIPLKQHIGAEGELCVSVGDRVLRGRAYPWTWKNAAGTRAHLRDGYRYCPHSTAHPSALAELSVIIDADGEDRWIEREGWSDYRAHSREALIERIHQYGVAGLGGAGFPPALNCRAAAIKSPRLLSMPQSANLTLRRTIV